MIFADGMSLPPHLIFLDQLIPELTEQNKKLAEKYNIEGSFPLVVLVDKNGKVLGKMGFKNVSPEEYIKMIHALEIK